MEYLWKIDWMICKLLQQLFFFLLLQVVKNNSKEYTFQIVLIKNILLCVYSSYADTCLLGYRLQTQMQSSVTPFHLPPLFLGTDERKYDSSKGEATRSGCVATEAIPCARQWVCWWRHCFSSKLVQPLMAYGPACPGPHPQLIWIVWPHRKTVRTGFVCSL